MPLTVQFQFVGLGSNTEKFALIVEARGALPPLDIGLGDEREDVGCRFYQRGEKLRSGFTLAVDERGKKPS